MRRFNTAGPCRPEWHYMLPAAARLPQVPDLVESMGYFVVRAPRQTGKTTALQAIASELTASGRYAALAFSCQSAGAVGDDSSRAQVRLLTEIRAAAEDMLPAELVPAVWPAADEEALRLGLRAWSRACPRPIVLFFDEIDALVGESMRTVLSQLRTGHGFRPDTFPASVGLCGLRDVREYKAASGGDSSRLGSQSPFNVLVESLRLGDFSVEEIGALYGQHTSETGRMFTDAGVEYAFELTRGQPWLVNALAREVVEKMAVPVQEAVGPRRLEVAKERLIRARVTHLDSLAAKLAEPRVRRVIEPMIAGDVLLQGDPYDDDASYVHDLGLVAQGGPVAIANPIYREVVLRVLGAGIERNVTVDPRSFVLADGRLDFAVLLTEFASFWKQHGEVLTEREAYHEAAPQLVLMAFLHRIINGGGCRGSGSRESPDSRRPASTLTALSSSALRPPVATRPPPCQRGADAPLVSPAPLLPEPLIDREYGVGRGRIDLCVRWPYQDADGKRVFQREAMELKVWRDNRPDPLAEGLAQLDDYLDRLELATGVLVLFDRREDAKPLCDRIVFDTAQSPSGRDITLLRA